MRTRLLPPYHHHHRAIYVHITLVGVLASLLTATSQVCTTELLEACSPCLELSEASLYDCTSPGLEDLKPGEYEGVKVNYLSFVTQTSSPNFPVRAAEFEACTGGKIIFSEAANIWDDPVLDLGTKTSRGSELYDGYFMSYSHFPEVSALDLAEHLNDKIREDNGRLKWEDVLPKVKAMGEYRKNGVTNIDFLMYDGDFFVPIIRLDLLEKHNLPLPNTWEEVVEYAKFFNGTDLNDDGDPDDFGFCHFPRLGAGHWDWWFSEAVYSTWATSDQTLGINQGFFFDEDTMEPRFGAGFRRAAEIWKQLWTHGSDSESKNFATGRCAIGFGPPGSWKQIFLNRDGVSRKDMNGTVVWRPTMESGEYAEPYRFKPFGSTEVVDRSTGQLTPCTPKLCPKAEVIPARGHHGKNDRAGVLERSPLEGQLINRAPFYWSGGLGTLIRKSAPERRKDLMWDFFVYTNSPDSSVYDVANYLSWLDSWRFSQLVPGNNFIEAGWSRNAYEEHTDIMQWALSTDVNGAFNLRLPASTKYTRDVVGEGMRKYIDGDIQLDDLTEEVRAGWNDITEQEGKLHQLEIYRSSLGLDLHSEVDLCRLHRALMDVRDPSVCRQYDPSNSQTLLLLAILVPGSITLSALLLFLHFDQKRRSIGEVWKIRPSELHLQEPPKVLGRGTFGVVLLAEYRGTSVAVKRVIPPRNLEVILPKATAPGDGDLEKQINPKSNSHLSAGTMKLKEFFERYDDFGQNTVSSIGARPECSKTISGSLSLAEVSVAAVGHASSASEREGGGLKDLSWLEKLKFETDKSKKATWLERLKYGDEYTKLKADFVLEMKHLSKLRHPCITTVMGAIVAKDAEPMLVMELMDHGSLFDVLQNETIVIDGEILLPILRDITQGVRFLHAATPQIIHCDLKASNILVDSRFRAKVADFGLTQKQKLGAAGTPYFLAPEILRGETVNTPESDAYAFGMILYECYSRKYPYEGEDFDDVIRLVADRDVNKRPPVPSSCPPKAQTLMGECLCSDPKQRPTFEELDLQLKRLKAETIDLIGMQTSAQRKSARTNSLLFEVFPKHVALALRDGRKVEPESRENVTIFFCDIVGFTNLSAELASPLKVSDMLDRLYTKFDALSGKSEIYKVETIGDSYMAVTNLIKEQKDHAKLIAEFAFAAIKAANSTLIDEDDPGKGFVDIRVGFSSGPVVANVVGSLNPRYCLFGDVVNTASRMESASMKNRIHCSEVSAMLLKEQCPKSIQLIPRGAIEIKGKGEMFTFWVQEKNLEEFSAHWVDESTTTESDGEDIISV